MVLNLAVEKIYAKVDVAQSAVQDDGFELAVNPVETPADETQVEVAIHGENVRAEFLVDVENEVMVATEFQADRTGRAKDALRACEHVGRSIDCGSVFIPSDTLDRSDDFWTHSGFGRNYVRSLSPARLQVPGSEPGFVTHDDADTYCKELERVVDMRLQWGVAHAERPYIVSLDVSSDLAQGENARFHCFVHFHELSKACFIEKMVVPPDRRGNGIGTEVFRRIRRLAERNGCRYVYLVAKKDAEAFWTRQGFAALQRANYRSALRRVEALRKRPGWDVARVGTARLSRPVWHYRNHPQDDLDLASGIRLLNLF